jgi:hypothetical protein
MTIYQSTIYQSQPLSYKSNLVRVLASKTFDFTPDKNLVESIESFFI